MAADGRGVIYIGHIPVGFEEKQMKEYFSQFGNVTRMKLSRSTRTGRPKGYGFVEFDSEEVAGIAAESMHGYLMFNRVLKCHVLSPEEIHPSMFNGCQRRLRPSMKWKKAVTALNEDKSEVEADSCSKKLHKRVQHQVNKLRKMGLNPPNPFVNEVR